MYGTRPANASGPGSPATSAPGSRSTSPTRGRSSENATKVAGTTTEGRESSSRSRSRLGRAVQSVFSSHGHQDLSFADEHGLERQARDRSRQASRNASRNASRANSPSRAPIAEVSAEEEQRGRLESALRETSLNDKPEGVATTEKQPKSRSTSRARIASAVKKVFSSHAPPQDLSFADEHGLERQARDSSRSASRAGSRSASRAGSRSASRQRPIAEEGSVSTAAGHYGAVRA